jgi:hypothetical protein
MSTQSFCIRTRLRLSARIAIALLALLGAAGATWGQSQFPSGAASVGTSGDPNNGDRDATAVLFFEVPDDAVLTGGLLYFAINDPGFTGTGALLDLKGTTGNSHWSLLGGTGALSDPSS